MGDLSAAEILAVLLAVVFALFAALVWSLAIVDRWQSSAAERDRERRINDWHAAGFTLREAERIVGGQ